MSALRYSVGDFGGYKTSCVAFPNLSELEHGSLLSLHPSQSPLILDHLRCFSPRPLLSLLRS